MNYLNKNKLTVVGILLGSLGGYLYYYYVGCASGSCSITSKPINSSLYGAVVGGLVLNMFQKRKNCIMKDRILTGWTFQRGIYVILGGIVIVQAALEQQWVIMALGGYFAAMGLFNFGCAAECYGGSCRTPNYSETEGKPTLPETNLESKKV